MADTNTRVIIDVSLNSEDATKRANELGNSIKSVKQEQKELKTANQETGVAFQSNAQQLRLLTAEQKAYISISQAAEGSNNQLRAQLSLLTQQYNALGKEERDGTTAGKALQIQIKGISDELKVNESAVGDNRRNVGNYKDALASATETTNQQKESLSGLTSVMDRAPIGFKLFGDQVGNVKNQLQNFKQAQGEAKEAQQRFQEAQTIATQASEEAAAATAYATEIGFKFSKGEATAAQAELARATATDAVTVSTAAATSATEAQTVATTAGTNAAKVFKVALASTGIGAIIILVAALISYLSKFDPIVDKVEQGFAAVGAVVDTVGRFFVKFISSITSVGDLLSKLGNILSDPIGSFKELGSAMTEAAGAAIELKKAQQDLEDQNKIQEVSNAKALQQIQQLTLQARNRALSEKERQDLLKQASKIDQDNFNQRTKLANEEIRQAQKQIAITAGLSAEEQKRLDKEGLAYAFALKDKVALTDEQVDALKAAEIKRTEILTESTNRQEKLQNQSDALAEKAAAEEEKRLAKLQQAREKAADAENARLESLMKTNESILTERQNEIEAINRDIDEKVAKYKKYGATTEQLEKERTARLLQVQTEYNTQNQELILANTREIEDLVVEGIKDEGTKSIAQLQLNQSRRLEETDKQIEEIKKRIQKGETGLTDVLKSTQEVRSAQVTANNQAMNALLEEQYKVDLERFNQHQVDLANAKIANAGTDAEKLVAQQELLEAQYQLDLNNAIRTGQDTTLIVAENEQRKRDLQQQTNDFAFASFKNFSSSFQGMVSENSAAYKIAGAIQAKVDAAQALRNNILIIQENVKALTSQGKLPFPANIVAIFSTLAALGAALSSAKTLLSPPKFADGGVFSSDGRGAVLPGYSKTDNTNAKLRSGEAVIVSEATKDPRALAALSAINVAYGGRALAPGYAMATGGIAQGGFVSDISSNTNSSVDVANLVVTAMQSAPAPIVDVRQIISGINTNQVSVGNSNL